MTPDFSTLTTADVSKIALQRTQHLLHLPVVRSPSFQLWRLGSSAALNVEAKVRRRQILEGAMRDALALQAEISRYLDGRTIQRMVDIGCGHALIDLPMWRTYGCHLHLVDIEESSGANYHGFAESGAGYASLTGARDFLVANGVPASSITTTNPQRDQLHDENCDLIISLISAGFHYPISTYTDFALSALKPGGVLIFDARKGESQEEHLKAFSRVDVVAEGEKFTKLAAIK